MSDDIYIYNGEAQMLYTGEVPWHGLGTELPTYFGVEELHQYLPVLMSDHELTPDVVWIPNPDVMPGDAAYHVPATGKGRFHFTDQRNVMRSVDRAYLGKVGSGFEIIPPSEIVESIAVAILGEDLKLETSALLGERGQSAFFLARDPGAEITIRRSDGTVDRSEVYVLFSVSFDGTGTLRVCRTSVRVVCRNTERMALRGAAGVFKVRHTTNWRDRVPELIEAIGGVRRANAEYAAQAQALENAPIDRPTFSAVLDSVLGIDESKPLQLPATVNSIGRELSEQLAAVTDKRQTRRINKREKVLDLFEHGTGNQGRSGWDAFNAATEWETHHAPVRGAKDPSMRRMMRAMVASSTPFSQEVGDALVDRLLN